MRVIASNPNEPVPTISSLHTPEVWVNEGEVRLAWADVGDPLLDYYEVCWEGTVAGCDNVSDPSFSRTLPDGNYDFAVRAFTTDGQQSGPGKVDDLRIDTTPPTLIFAPLPDRVQAPQHQLSWSSSDASSGVVEHELTYRITRAGAVIADWDRETDATGASTHTIVFDFPGGQHGDLYDFCLRAKDQVDLWSQPVCQTTTFNPDPELAVIPNPIHIYRLYDDPTPSVRTIAIENYGGLSLDWTVSPNFGLITLDKTSGTAPDTLQITATHPGQTITEYTGYLTFNSPTPAAKNVPLVVEIKIIVVESFLYLPLIQKP